MYQPPLDPELAHLAEFDVGFGDDGIDLATIRAIDRGIARPPTGPRWGHRRPVRGR